MYDVKKVRNKHELWLNRYFGRLSRSRGPLDALTEIRKLFPGATPEIQRQIVMVFFTNLRLRDRRLTVALKPPFVFLAESEMPSPLDQDAFRAKALEKQMA